jgi:hypothetical protein
MPTSEPLGLATVTSSDFKEKIMDKLDKQLKHVVTVVEQPSQKLSKELRYQLQET